MKILLTGGNGFLGSNMLDSFEHHDVITLGRHHDDDIPADITRSVPMLPPVDIVIHAAGKAHTIPKNDQEAKAFYEVNVDGTRNLANQLVLSDALPDTFVFISTVAVYGVESGEGIEESTALSGNTPYARSKIEAESFLLDWGEKYGVSIIILRLPLIVGKNAPGNLGAMVRNIRRGTYARIGSGEARRSMVLASDVAKLIPTLIGKQGIYNLTDGVHPSFAMLEDHISKSLGKKIHAIPPMFAVWLARLGDAIPGFPFNTYRYSKIIQSLTFSDQEARQKLGWKPTPVLEGYLP
jgi:nucleoside-diphosphate-sugar epimerase